MDAVWQSRGIRSTSLLPLAWLYGAITRRRRRRLERSRNDSPLPVLVIGNLTVGGTGKTPLVVAIATICAALGIRCGIVSRGYGGRAQKSARAVVAGDDPIEVGDEPLMLHRLTGVPVTVCVSRVDAVASLAARGDIDLVLADDGLQHYAMARAGEVCVVDAARGFGNGRLLPAGPLREGAARLAGVDVIALRGDDLSNGYPPGIDSWPVKPSRGTFTLEPERLATLGGEHRELCMLEGLRVHAVAGIGRPQRLFETVRALGAEVVPHAYPDHHRFIAADLAFGDRLPIVTTSKDAVKIEQLLPPSVEVLELQMRTVLSAPLDAALAALLNRLIDDRETQE